MTTENSNDSNVLQISAVNNNEPIIIGSINDDELIGDSGSNFIADNDLFDSSIEDNDRLEGRGGDDFLFASGGDDTLIGGTGNDSLFGGEGNDVAIFVGNDSEYRLTITDPWLGISTVESLTDPDEGIDRLSGIETIRFGDEEISMDDMPIEEEPVDETPVDETPEDEEPVDETPVDETLEEEEPVDETLEEEEPVDETPKDETPEESVGSVGSIDVFVSSPSSIVADGTDVVTVTYTNTGDTDAIAPLLSLEAEGALLRPNDETEFSETQIQFLGISNEGQAGVLASGETNSFTVEFQVDGTTEEGINFSVSSIDNDEEIDWESLRESSRPDFIELEAWNEIYDNFLTEVGTTAGDYQQLLVDNANYLSDLGDYEADADDLLAFEFQQASDYQAISQRNSLGSFGRGRTFIGDIELSVDDEGNVAIDNTGTSRSFTLLADGTYQGQPGDFATLSLDEGVYTLTEPDGTATVFDSEGKIDFIEDTNGNLLDAEYTDEQLTSLSDSFGNSLNFEYNTDSRIVTVTDSDGRVTNYEYDQTGELLTAVTDEAGTTTYTYDGVALASISDPNGTTIEFTYDDRGRLTQQSVSGEGTATEVLNYSYGEAGEVTVTDALGNETELLLNENGQVGQLTDANGRLINFSYDAQGNLTQIVAPENNTTLFGYDGRGNLTSQVDAEGNQTNFTYEENFNQLTGFTNPLGNGIDYDYDESGNLTTITYEDGSTETFSYDANGDVTISVNRRGQEILYSYNDRGQIVSQINPDAEVPIEYTYDAQGNLDTVTDGNGTIDLDYDDSDRLIKITYPNDRFLEYTYDEGDRRTSLTDQDGNTVNYTYDDAGRLASLTDGDDNLIVSYQYDEVGRLAREEKGNGTYTEYSYDLAGQLLSIENYAPDDTLNSSSVYTYDSLGRQTSLTSLDGTWTYGYDATGQLTSADFVSTNPEIPDQNLTYEYDAAGNRITTTENGESVDYTTNNLNQYTDVDGFEYQYDDDGNLVSQTTDEGTFLYGYNSENQIVSVTSPDSTATTYEYDPFGNRIASVVDGERTEYLIDPFGFGDVVAEYDGNGNLTASYTHGLGLESITNPEASYYYDFNATGSTLGLTDADGEVVNSYFYDPFGDDINETKTVANPFEFVGEYGVTEEANGLDFMRARFYDSGTGRFISPDPIGLNGRDTNLYRYVSNKPSESNDPKGTTAPLAAAGAITGGIIGAATYIFTTTIRPSKDFSLGGFFGSVTSGAIYGGVIGATGGVSLFGSGLLGGSALGGLSNSAGQLVENSIQIYRDDEIDFTRANVVDSIGSKALEGLFTGWFPTKLLKINAGNFIKPRYPYWGGGYPGLISTLRGNEYGQVLYSTLGLGALGNTFAELVDESYDVFDPLTNSITNLINDASIAIFGKPLFQARSKGEPHLTTFDGVGYDFQGAGDFTLVESVDGDLDVQVRYVQIDDNVTVASAVATEVDGQNVVIDSEGIEFVEDPNDPDNLIPRVFRSGGGSNEATVTIDGEEVEIASGGSIEVGNSRIFRSSGEEYTIVYAGENGVLEDGDDQLVVNYLRPGTINIVDVYLGDEQQGQISGLLGNLNGNPDDDIALPDGTVLPRPLEFDQLYGEYRDAYRVTSIEESLFTYEDGQNPDTFFNPNFPEALITYDTLPPDLRAKGDAAALEAGYEPGTFEFESVAFDFAITCDPAFLEGRETDPEADGVDIVDDDDSVVVEEGTASISGIKFNDLNGNGVRDSDLVQGANPDVIFTIDVSGSTDNDFVGTSVGDVNNDNNPDSILDAELAGFIALNEQLIEDGLGDTANVGIVVFGSSGIQVDLDPSTEGLQLTTTSNADNNSNGILDVEEVLRTIESGAFNASTGTNFNDALAASEQSFIDLETEPGDGNLIFLSDGNGSGSFEDEVQRLNELGVNISAFGVGENAALNDLQIIDPGREPEDQIFTSTDQLLANFGGISQSEDGEESESLIEPGLEGITIYLDLNDNGELDDNEPSQVTDENGEYSFTELEAGTYVVREVLPDDSTQTAPEDGQFTIELEEGQIVENTDFGNTGVDSSTDDSESLSIQIETFSPDLNTPTIEPLIVEINDDVEYSEATTNSIVGVNIDFDFGVENGTILFEVDESAGSGVADSVEFNGWVFTDVSDEIPAIENVTIDESTNTFGLEAEDISFTENTIEVNGEGLPFSPGLSTLLNVEFANV
ncbi:MAG: RHS repeat-associated core domain-containing protein [Cyanobacteria bacterium P01_G01_bin.19]